MDLAGGEGISTGVSLFPSPSLQSMPSEKPESCTHYRGSGEIGHKAGHLASHSSGRPVHESDLHSSKERWLPVSGGEPKTPELFCQEVPLQDGGCKHAEGPTSETRLDGVYRPERCVLLSKDSGDRQKVSALSLGGGRHTSFSAFLLGSAAHPGCLQSF